MSNSSKGFAHILLIILVLLGIVGVGYLILTNNSNIVVCGDGICEKGEKCIRYMGVAGNNLSTCGIPCPNGDSDCPSGMQCTVIYDGPGPICSTDSFESLSSTNKVSNWNTYRNEEYGFEVQYPSDWSEAPKTITGSGFYQDFDEGDSEFDFTILVKGNYNQLTGKPYESLDDFIGLSYTTKKLAVGGQEARQPLPRAGSENVNGVNFFSRDNEAIYTLTLKSGDTALNTSEDVVKQGQKTFNEILSTFKFAQDIPSNDQVKALEVYREGQLSTFVKQFMSDTYWPKLKPFISSDENREVYLVDCGVSPDYHFTGIPTIVPNNSNIIENTLNRLLQNHYGGFPKPEEINSYSRSNSFKYKNEDSGINAVTLDEEGTLIINFYDTVAAYGGGSGRVVCMKGVTELTMKQFPEVKEVIMCIDKYPTEENENCFYDFQP